MIPRLNRLPSTHINTSHVVSTPLFILRFSHNNLSYSRFAFVISKKVDKRAVVRNRLKRVLREIAYEKTLSQQIGEDLLFIVKRNFVDIPRQEVESIVENALTQIVV